MRVRYKRLREDTFTQNKINNSILKYEDDKRKASVLENLLLDKWNDHKFMNVNFKIQSQLNAKSNRRL